jgi:hypothetical protein
MKFYTPKSKKEYLVKILTDCDKRMKECKLCGGTGSIYHELTNPIGDGKLKMGTFCECMRDSEGEPVYPSIIEEEIKPLEEMIKLIPLEYEKASLDRSPISEQIFEFMNSKDFIIGWIHGMTGCGKTMTAYALKAYCLVNNRPEVIIVKDYSLLDINSAEPKFLEHKGLLVIDDIGAVLAAKIANYYLDVYHKIIDHRRENRLKTIFTSNMGINDWCKWAREVDSLKFARITSRMSGVSMEIKMPDKDYRKEV